MQKTIRLSIAFIFTMMISSANAQNGFIPETAKKMYINYIYSLNQGKYDFIVDSIPDKILAKQSKLQGYDKNEFRDIVVDRYKKLYFEKPTMVYYLDEKSLERNKINDDLSFYKGVFMFEFTQKDGSLLRAKTNLFAVNDREKWYFIRADEKSLLSEYLNIYPQLKDLKTDDLTFEIIEEK